MKIRIKFKNKETQEEKEINNAFITDYAISCNTLKNDPYFWNLRYKVDEIEYAVIED